MKTPGVRAVENKIGIMAPDWEGRCHQVASMIVDKFPDVFNGAKLRYGLWTGPIAPGSCFEGRPFTHHGWIEMPDGSIVDPTRWVFEGRKPYIYAGTLDERLYDTASDKFRTTLMRPCPKRKNGNKLFGKPLTKELVMPLSRIAGFVLDKTITVNQAFWIANLPMSVLGHFAKPVYEWLIASGSRAMIPIDNRRYILGG
jgi:hypothetical protein